MNYVGENRNARIHTPQIAKNNIRYISISDINATTPFRSKKGGVVGDFSLKFESQIRSRPFSKNYSNIGFCAYVSTKT